MAKAKWKRGTASGYAYGSKENGRDKQLRHNYGITLKQFDQIFSDQGCKCAVCGTRDVVAKVGSGWCLDHCHRTGMIRGVLCSWCNKGLGMLRDSKEILTAAIAYLDQDSRLYGRGLKITSEGVRG